MLFPRFRLRRKHHLMALVLVVAPLTMAILVLLMVPPATSWAAGAGDLASGSGGGGCFGTSAPVCTFTQRAALADFSSLSPDGCVATDAFISVFESLTRPGNVSGQFPLVTISKFDICHNVGIEAASNLDFTGTIQFGTGLSSVAVVGTSTMIDKFSGATFTATINVAWQGYGSITRSIDASHSHGPGFIVTTHFNGSNRAAEASGTLSDGTTNYAAVPTLIAELDNAKGGTVLITAA